MNKEGKRKAVNLLYEDLHLQSLLGNSAEDEQLSLKTGPLTPTARNVWKRRRLFYIKKHTDLLPLTITNILKKKKNESSQQ